MSLDNLCRPHSNYSKSSPFDGQKDNRLEFLAMESQNTEADPGNEESDYADPTEACVWRAQSKGFPEKTQEWEINYDYFEIMFICLQV